MRFRGGMQSVDGSLKIRPTEHLTDFDRELIRSWKPQLLSMLGTAGLAGVLWRLWTGSDGHSHSRWILESILYFMRDLGTGVAAIPYIENDRPDAGTPERSNENPLYEKRKRCGKCNQRPAKRENPLPDSVLGPRTERRRFRVVQ